VEISSKASSIYPNLKRPPKEFNKNLFYLFLLLHAKQKQNELELKMFFTTMFTQIKAYYKQLIPSLQEADWECLQQKLAVQKLKKGELLTRSGEICRQVSFINKGLLRMFYVVDGKEICTGFAPENEYLAQYDSFLMQQPSAGNIDALEDCELINLSYTDMQALYKTYPVFETFGRKIAEMLFIMISSQTNRLLTLDPEERYQSIIQYQPFVIQRVPQYMIASFIGITPEHLSRIRKKSAGTRASVDNY
jgi:CRP-like cAMP-binding protein